MSDGMARAWQEYQSAADAANAVTSPLTRSATFLTIMAMGLEDMAGSDHDQVLRGFCGLVVFGRSVTFAMQNFRSSDEEAFDTWYEPWRAELTADPLCHYFAKLRNEILKGVTPTISVVLASMGERVAPPGTVTLDGRDPPTTHLGETIADVSVLNLSRLYFAYLSRMHESFAPLVFEVFDRIYPLPPSA